MAMADDFHKNVFFLEIFFFIFFQLINVFHAIAAT